MRASDTTIRDSMTNFLEYKQWYRDLTLGNIIKPYQTIPTLPHSTRLD
jgi:hypothetical protein